MRKVTFIARKEFYHILRDPRSLTIAILMPVIMTFLYGFAISLDIENVTIAVIDYDNSVESRRLTDTFYHSRYFSAPKRDVIQFDPEENLRNRNAKAVLVIQPGFGNAVRSGSDYALGLLVDGSDNNLSAAIKNYTNQLVLSYWQKLTRPGTDVPGVSLSVQVLYNPDLKSSHFFVPGLLAIILLMISALLTSITLAREKETGTMEQLLTAPVTPKEIIVGKLIPYVALALLDGILVLVFAKILFGVPFVGSKLTLLAFGLLYIITSLAVGILISSVVQTQQVAMMLAMVTTLLPSVMLSEFIFAVRNMPVPLQALSYIIPAKYFNAIIRGVMLKGAGFETLLLQGGFLIALMILLMGIAAAKFKTRIN